MPGKTLLVTGGAGFIGSHIAETLHGAGWKVTVFDDLSSGRRENLPNGVELIVGDIRTAALATLVRERRFDAISHHAAQMDVRRSVADPLFDADTNVMATLRMLEAARQHPDTHVVFASTGGAIYGEPLAGPCREDHPTRPQSPYGCSKLAAEGYLRYYADVHRLPVTILRYANVYGPRQSPHGEAGVVAIFVNRMLAGEACTITADGSQTRDYVFVGDVADVHRRALEHRRCGIFNVGTAVETDVRTLHDRLAALVPSARPPLRGPDRPGEQQRSVVDPTLLLSTFELAGMTPLAPGLERTVESFRRR